MAVYMCRCDTAGIEKRRTCDAEVAWAGKVLDTFERNGYHDSDFVALVWDDDAGATREVVYGSTSYWSYHNRAEVDATPDIVGKAVAAYRKAWIARAVADTGADHRKVRMGATVRSTTTRGPNVGLVGEVRWTGAGRYGPRVGILVGGRKSLTFLSADRVEVVDPAPVDEEEIIAYAETVTPRWKCMAAVGA